MRTENVSGTTVLTPDVDVRPRKNWRSWLIGPALPTADAPHQTIGKAVGLAVFASDALSSTAYATQEIMIILAFAGIGALGYVFPISIAIVTLMAIVTISYEQTIHAYPGGGGAYIVARDNLGELPAQAAGAALLTDYILTVAVSISSGVAQITSAFPNLYQYPRGNRGQPGAARDADQPARRQRVGHGLCHPHLFLRDHHVYHRGCTAFSATLPAAWAWWSIRPPWPCLQRLDIVTPFLLLHAFCQRHRRPDRDRGHLQRHHRL